MTSHPCVFVIDDDEMILNLLEEPLTDGGFDVRSASDFDTAMKMLDAEGATYSALITDIDLQGKCSGWELARRAREINDKLPVVYITGSNGHEWASKGVPNSQFIQKPFAIAQIVTAVSQLINNTASD